MIVKVQVPLISNDPDIPALVYPEGKRWTLHLPLEMLPPEVLAATEHGAKAFFHIEMTDEYPRKILWGKQADWQDW